MPWELPNLIDADIVKEGWERLQPILQLNDIAGNISAPHAKISALEMTVYMRNMLLRDADWAGMAHSLEIRVPFVDIEVFRALASLMVSDSIFPKDFLALVPEKSLPKALKNRQKTGFSIPVDDWIKTDSFSDKQKQGLKGWARRLLQEF